MNKVILMGRLVADPEFSVGGSGTPYCRIRIAVDRSYAKQGEERQSDFFRITAFGKTAEFVNRFFVKGKPILIEGEIRNANYVDKNGVQQYRDEIIANQVNFVLSDPTRGNNGGNNYGNNYNNYNNANNFNNNQNNYNPNQNNYYSGNQNFNNPPAPANPAPQPQQAPPATDDFADYEAVLSDQELPF